MFKRNAAAIMHPLRSRRVIERSRAAVLLLLMCGNSARADTYDPSTMQLAIDTMMIGNATYSTMIVTIGSFVSGPTGTSPDSAVDNYVPASGQLTAPLVRVLDTQYYNLVGTVSGLVSVSSVNNADAYDGAILSISSVRVLNGALYSNVAISIGTVIKVGGGMPAKSEDVYDPETGELTIAAVEYRSQVYTNVVVTVGKIVSMGSGSGSLSVSPNSLTFICGRVSCGSDLPVHLTNSGNAPVYIFGATTSAEGNFSAYSFCSSEVLPGQSCDVYVSFESCPVPNGIKQATTQVACTGLLYVNDSASGSPQTVGLEVLVQSN